MATKTNGSSESVDSNVHEHDSTPTSVGRRGRYLPRPPFAWSVLATTLSAASLLLHQIKGKYWFMFNPEINFGWPFTFMIRSSTFLTLGGDPFDQTFYLETPTEDWIFLDHGYTYFSWLAIVGNVVVGLFVLCGVFAAVERFCVEYQLRFRFSITGILAIIVWFPMIYLMRYYPGIESVAFYLTLLEEVLFLTLLVATFGWLTFLFAGMKRVLVRST